MLNEIITIYAITDNLLKALGHDEDCRREGATQKLSQRQAFIFAFTIQQAFIK